MLEQLVGVYGNIIKLLLVDMVNDNWYEPVTGVLLLVEVIHPGGLQVDVGRALQWEIVKVSK